MLAGPGASLERGERRRDCRPFAAPSACAVPRRQNARVADARMLPEDLPASPARAGVCDRMLAGTRRPRAPQPTCGRLGHAGPASRRPRPRLSHGPIRSPRQPSARPVRHGRRATASARPLHATGPCRGLGAPRPHCDSIGCKAVTSGGAPGSARVAPRADGTPSASVSPGQPAPHRPRCAPRPAAWRPRVAGR